MTEPLTVDTSSLDPVSYALAIGLRPEDSYGCLPVDLDETSPLLYLYRESPEYESARSSLSGLAEGAQLAPARARPTQAAEFDISQGGGLGEMLEQMERLTRTAIPEASPVPAPDPERLGRIAKLRSSGAINDDEYQRLLAEAGVGAGTAAAGAPAAQPDGPPIASQRLYPKMRMRSSTR